MCFGQERGPLVTRSTGRWEHPHCGQVPFQHGSRHPAQVSLAITAFHLLRQKWIYSGCRRQPPDRQLCLCDNLRTVCPPYPSANPPDAQPKPASEHSLGVTCIHARLSPLVMQLIFALPLHALWLTVA